MAIEFDCPTCQTRIRTPDEAAGKKARCPKCQTIVPIPGGPGASPLGTLNPPLSGTPSAIGPPSNPFTSGPTAPAPATPSITSAAAKVNPQPTKAVPWLPPAEAFAPKGAGMPDYTRPGPTAGYGSPPLPVSNNPFGDVPPGNQGGPINPYASPSGYGSMSGYKLTKEEVRQKLLGPAIGIALGGILCAGMVVLCGIALLMDEGFHQDMQQGAQNDPAAVAFAYIFLALFGLIFAAPSFISLIGAWAMYRGHGLVAAWIGAIASVLPCNPCFFIGAGFGIWGMIVLNDPAVHDAMQ